MKIFRSILTLLFLAALGIIMFVTLSGHDGMDGLSWTILIAGLLTLIWGWRLTQGDALLFGAFWPLLFIVKTFNFFCWLAVFGWSALSLVVGIGMISNNVVLAVIMLTFTLVPWVLRMSSPSLRVPA